MTGCFLGLARWCARCSSVLLIASATIWVTKDPPYDNGPPIRSDGEGYHVWTYAILKGDLSFSWFRGDTEKAGLHQPDPAVRRFSCKYPLGVALLRLPVMAFVADPQRNGPPYYTAEHWACLILGAAALIATAALGLDSCYRLGVNPVWANAAVLLLTFGTGLFHYGTYDACYSHINSALLVAALVWLAVRAADGARPLPIIPVVMLTAALFLVRTTNILLIGFWMLGCIGSPVARSARPPGFRSRAISAAAFGLMLGLGVTLAVNYEMFGRLTLHTYPGEGFVWDDPHLLQVLTGERYGLLRLYPILGATVLAGLIAPRSRGWAIGLVLVLAAYTALYGYWWTWHLASGFGHRGFVEVVPLAIPVLALALSSLPRPAAWGAILLGGAATAYSLIQMWEYWHDRPYIPLRELIGAVML
jgi:hypothetical protein